MGSGCRSLPCAGCRVRDSITGYASPVNNSSLYSGPHIQEYLAGVDAERENVQHNGSSPIKTRWRKVEVALSSRRIGPAVLESDPIVRGQLEQELAGPGATESRHREPPQRGKRGYCANGIAWNAVNKVRGCVDKTPWVTMPSPSNDGEGGSVARDRRRRLRGSGRGEHPVQGEGPT